MIALKAIYLANILVAGWVGISCLFFPKYAEQAVMTNGFVYSEAFRMLGALWSAIFLLSFLGLFYPKQMTLVLLLQLIYKSSWLVFAALPAMLAHKPYPKPMATFFIIWVVVLPFIIPWKELFPGNPFA